MSKAIRWSPRAVADIEKHMNYLQTEWDQKVVAKVIDQISEIIKSVSENPELYPSIQHKRRIHRCVITPHLTLYYRVKSGAVELITFWDVRQNPKDLKL